MVGGVLETAMAFGLSSTLAEVFAAVSPFGDKVVMVSSFPCGIGNVAGDLFDVEAIVLSRVSSDVFGVLRRTSLAAAIVRSIEVENRVGGLMSR
jgi:hypothetical protein